MNTLSNAGTFGMIATVVAGAAMIGQGEVGPESKAKIGHAAPAFTLTDIDGNTHSLKDFEGNVVVLEWFNPKCPFVVAHYAKKTTMNDLASEFADDGVTWLRINSGKEGHSTTGVAVNKSAHEGWDMEGAILLDESGKVGRAYGAKTTPHMYVIDGEGMLRYMGAIDDRKNPETNYVEDAVKAVLAGETVEVTETKAYGCSVKY